MTLRPRDFESRASTNSATRPGPKRTRCERDRNGFVLTRQCRELSEGIVLEYTMLQFEMTIFAAYIWTMEKNILSIAFLIRQWGSRG